MHERGVIRNRAFKQQLNDFSGLRFGKITPTDLDAFMDFHNKLFVFVEAKHHGAEMPYGQRLALERVCDACHNPPHRYAVVFVTRHESEGDIDYAKTLVTRYRWNGRWLSPKHVGGTLVQGINAFRERCLQSNIIPFKVNA